MACDRAAKLTIGRANGVRERGTYGISVTPKMMGQIKLLLAEGNLSQNAISKIVGCSQTYVSQVKLGKVSWSNVQ